MPGWDLKKGIINSDSIDEDEYWRLFNYLFSSRSMKRNTYKYGFLKSILDNIFNSEKIDDSYFISYSNLFNKFTENYWNLVLRYNLKQMRKDGKSSNSKIEQILINAAIENPLFKDLEFSSISDLQKTEIISIVTKECKRYVVGALYKDFDGYLYSFDVKGNGIYLYNNAYNFILKYKPEIERLNYYSWALLLEQINDNDAIIRVLDKLELSTPKRNDLSIYRDILFKEYEQRNCFYCGRKLNSTMHVDHFIPWSFVKDDKIWNFVLTCPKCNTKKNNKLASKAYIERLKERNNKMKLDQKLKTDFDSYRTDLLEKMWNYAYKSGFDDIDDKLFD